MYEDQHEENGGDPGLIPHVLVCKAYEEKDIRVQINGTMMWKRVQQNQDERYHHFMSAPIGEPPSGQLPDLYLDFKKTLGLPMQGLYGGIRDGQITRVAVVPAIHVHDLVHRFYGFQSRVGLPE
jgi:hypothetical protein